MNKANSLLEKKVGAYLINLGYPSASILFDYLAPNERRIDLVVKSGDEIQVVVEVKGKSKLNLAHTEEIGYLPITRILQKNAQELGAKYYLLSNGEQYVWLQTGESGRPEPTSVIPYSQFDHTTLSEPKFTKEILHHTADFLRNYPITVNHLFDISLVVYTKLIKELKRDYFNLKTIIDSLNISEHSQKFDIEHDTEEIIKESLYRLELGNIELLKQKRAVVEFIDEVNNKNRKEWDVPRWLGDFIVKLAENLPKEKIVNLFAKHGNVTASAFLNKNKHILSYYSDTSNIYWLKTLHLLYTFSEKEIQQIPDLLTGNISNHFGGHVKTVVLVPPFNVKIHNADSYLFYSGVKDSTSIYLEKALEIVEPQGKVIAVVPDSFLLSKRFKKARIFLIKNASIELIVSLPTKTFMPYSSVKTSLMILKKESNLKSPCMVASIEVLEGLTIKDASTELRIKNVLLKYKEFKQGVSLSDSKTGFVVDNLNPANFHFSYYWLEKNPVKSDNLQEGFLSIPLKELIINIRKGNALVSDKNGEIPFIGPGVIRNMELRKEELAYTSKSKLPKNRVKIKEGEIVINSIGSHRGKAAYISKEFDGLAINRHVVLIEPNNANIHAGYLALALNSGYVQKQFYDKSRGTTIPTLNLQSFENIFIPVPSFEKQEKLYHSFLTLQATILDVKSGLFKLESSLNTQLDNLGKEGINL